MRLLSKRLLCLRFLLIACAISAQVTPARALPATSQNMSDIFIKIDNGEIHLKRLFSLIEKQTHFSFAYDENDVPLSKSVKVPTGSQLLKSVLDQVTEQTGLYFMEKDRVILVNKS